MKTKNTAYPVDSRYSWVVATGNFKPILFRQSVSGALNRLIKITNLLLQVLNRSNKFGIKYQLDLLSTAIGNLMHQSMTFERDL